MTINPTDVHDPVVQIFAGKEIDMDNFDPRVGPNATQRAFMVAHDLYAATKFFFFIVNLVLTALFGMKTTKDRVHAGVRLLGKLSAYFSIVEAQGRGSLHVHMLLWLQDAPNMETMHSLLDMPEFRKYVEQYINFNIQADIPRLDAAMVKETPQETQIVYSRPPDPGDSNWKAHFEDRLRHVVQSQQMHVCSWATCKQYDSHGHPVCKCRAPWELLEDTKVFANGEYIIHHRIPFMNNFNPSLSVTLNCNNDIKPLTNGSDTKHIMWYLTLYQSKKQDKSHNLSALLAEAYMYHDSKSDTDRVSGVVDQN